MVHRMTTSNNEWQQATISANFSFIQIREELTNKQPKEHSKDHSLNLEDDSWRGLIELRAGTSP